MFNGFNFSFTPLTIDKLILLSLDAFDILSSLYFLSILLTLSLISFIEVVDMRLVLDLDLMLVLEGSLIKTKPGGFMDVGYKLI